MSILVRTTSGNFTMDRFFQAGYTAAEALADAQIQFPNANLTEIFAPNLARYMKPEEVVEDGWTVHAISPQPVDA